MIVVDRRFGLVSEMLQSEDLRGILDARLHNLHFVASPQSRS